RPEIFVRRIARRHQKIIIGTRKIGQRQFGQHALDYGIQPARRNHIQFAVRLKLSSAHSSGAASRWIEDRVGASETAEVARSEGSGRHCCEDIASRAHASSLVVTEEKQLILL